MFVQCYREEKQSVCWWHEAVYSGMCVMQVFFNPDALSIIHMQSQSATGGEETCHSVTNDNVSQVSQVSLLNISSSFFLSAQVNRTLPVRL